MNEVACSSVDKPCIGTCSEPRDVNSRVPDLRAEDHQTQRALLALLFTKSDEYDPLDLGFPGRVSQVGRELTLPVLSARSACSGKLVEEVAVCALALFLRERFVPRAHSWLPVKDRQRHEWGRVFVL